MRCVCVCVCVCVCSESVKLLREEGLDNVHARHHRLGEGVRRAVQGWGLQVRVCVSVCVSHRCLSQVPLLALRSPAAALTV